MSSRRFINCLLCNKENNLLTGHKLSLGIIKTHYETDKYNIMLQNSKVCIKCIGHLQQLNNMYDRIKDNETNQEKENSCDMCLLTYSTSNQFLPPSFDIDLFFDDNKHKKWKKNLKKDHNHVLCFSCLNFIHSHDDLQELLEESLTQFYNVLTTCRVTLKDCSKYAINGKTIDLSEFRQEQFFDYLFLAPTSTPIPKNPSETIESPCQLADETMSSNDTEQSENITIIENTNAKELISAADLTTSGSNEAANDSEMAVSKETNASNLNENYQDSFEDFLTLSPVELNEPNAASENQVDDNKLDNLKPTKSRRLWKRIKKLEYDSDMSNFKTPKDRRSKRRFGSNNESVENLSLIQESLENIMISSEVEPNSLENEKTVTKRGRKSRKQAEILESSQEIKKEVEVVLDPQCEAVEVRRTRKRSRILQILESEPEILAADAEEVPASNGINESTEKEPESSEFANEKESTVVNQEILSENEVATPKKAKRAKTPKKQNTKLTRNSIKQLTIEIYDKLKNQYNIRECFVHLMQLQVDSYREKSPKVTRRSSKLKNKEMTSPKAVKIKLGVSPRGLKRKLRNRTKSAEPEMLVVNQATTIESSSSFNISDPLVSSTSSENFTENGHGESTEENNNSKTIEDDNNGTTSNADINVSSSSANASENQPPAKKPKFVHFDKKSEPKYSKSQQQNSLISNESGELNSDTCQAEYLMTDIREFDVDENFRNDMTEIEFLHPKYKNKAIKFQHAAATAREEQQLLCDNDLNSLANLDLSNVEYLDDVDVLEDLLLTSSQQNHIECPIYTMDELLNEDSLINVT